MSVDALFEGLKNIFGTMTNLVEWGWSVESNLLDFLFKVKGDCSFEATNYELVFTDQVNGVGKKPKIAFCITQNLLAYLLNEGLKIEFKQIYRASVVDLVFILTCGNEYLKIKVYDIDYDVAKEALEKITKEVYKIRGVRESREGEQNVGN